LRRDSFFLPRLLLELETLTPLGGRRTCGPALATFLRRSFFSLDLIEAFSQPAQGIFTILSLRSAICGNHDKP